MMMMYHSHEYTTENDVSLNITPRDWKTTGRLSPIIYFQDAPGMDPRLQPLLKQGFNML